MKDIAKVAAQFTHYLLIVHIARPVDLVYVAVADLCDEEKDEEAIVGYEEAVEEKVRIVEPGKLFNNEFGL